MRQILPADAAGTQISEPGDSAAGQAGLAAIAALYAYPPSGRPWLRANMVSSADGAATLDGRSGGLSGGADQAVFSVLRSLADVIVVGAATARVERYRPVTLAEAWPPLREGRPATPPIAVVTRRMFGLEPGGPLLSAGPGQARTIVLTSQAAPAALREAVARTADVIVAGAHEVSPAALISVLAGRGYRAILTEGGPRLLAEFTAAGLLDELCLTISPVLAGGQAGRIVAAPPEPASAGPPRPAEPPGPASTPGPAGLALAHVLEDNGHLLCRYLRAAG
ncbi:MAG TPA: dihydrofolate reductase family protein [Streptosporangiaceae bacterium]